MTCIRRMRQSSSSRISTTLIRWIQMRCRLARIAFFHRTFATNRPLPSARVSSTRGAAFLLAYGANSVSKPLRISSRFHRFPKTSMNRAFWAKNSINSSALCHFSPAKKLSSVSFAWSARCRSIITISCYELTLLVTVTSDSKRNIRAGNHALCNMDLRGSAWICVTRKRCCLC